MKNRTNDKYIDIRNRMLYPNCSEAVMRIKTSNLTSQQKRDLLKDLEDLENMSFSELIKKKNKIKDKDETSVKLKEKICDTLAGIEEEDDTPMQDTSIRSQKIFGVDCIVIDGDGPFNSEEKIRKVLDMYNIPEEDIECEEK